ncbi:putative Agenet-like domain-containing protein [Rosa chinensis]|uniref:Putative Agenet-like domain-containing protein n=1 Tax=Rosa chinensis TaxID=74649 RepID=A0A2P6P8H2_ROSCH|nr:uncharacterized protein LOC112175740 isoform X1 [Rosa chinensis]XP_024169238.1 uncharacterized protein LOC112175740 isoform X1 [Rosa chinensis]XP_040365966.1 uncharacterized protein LOC112175740 isoform X1 [Rosa chinensis]XP_040365967.1 uncharacterized protein LOC112175740 isoform X1 [Rosa chinensis]PRQ18219.1 putative Agenet-like domain-containing protein [Rosa chinensis]
MEYDDNDFQSQNLQLAGEGSTNCPPVLQPYGLPKFDFDDSLQGHLRFDSLVETEVFLGIESSEANNWIEDFSRGSSGIEFSSSAVESCSISRRNNVWSEATSSESVEMLLKSVGQEEIIPAQTILEESDACKEVGCIKQMDTNLKNDDNILTETGDVRDLHSTLLLDETAGNLSGLDNVGDQPRLEDASQTQEVELPVDGNSSVLDPNSVSDRDRLPVTTGSLTDDKGKDVNNMEFDNLVDYPPDKKMHENSSASEMQVDNMMTSVRSIITSSDELNNQDVPHHIVDITEENPGSHDVASIDIQCRNDLDKPHCLASEVESGKKEIANEDTVIDVQEASKIMLQGDSILHTMGGCSDKECPGVLTETNKCEDLVLSKDPDVGGDQSTMTYTNDAGYGIEVRNNLGEISSSLDPILKGESDLQTVDRCTDRECPEVLDDTNKCEDVVISFKDTDTGGVPAKSDKNDSGYGTEDQNSNTGVLSGLDPTLKGDSNLCTMDVCTVKESPEVPSVSLKATDTGGDQSKLHTPDLSPNGNDTGHAVELGNSVSACASPTLRTDNDLHTVDASSDRKCLDVHVETTKCEDIVLSKGTDTTGDQSNISPHVLSPVAYKSDTVYADEVGNSNSGFSSSLDSRLKVNSGKSTEEDALKSGGQPIDSEILVRKSEASMAVIEETEVFKGRGDENPEVHSNLTPTCSSAEMPSEVHVTGASKSLHDAFGVSAEELNEESHVSPSNLKESTERCSENEVCKEGISGKCDQDLSYSEKDTTNLPVESNSMDLEFVGSAGKGDESSSLCEDSAEKELIVPTLKHDVDGNASVADVPLESCDLASCGTRDVVPLSSENGATTHIHNVSVVPAAPSPAMGSHSDNKGETAIEISKDTSVSGTVSSPMVESGPGPVCEAEKGASCDTAGQLLCNTLDQSLPISVSCNTENQSEPGTAVAIEISKRSTTDMEVKRGDDAEAQDGATTENKSTTEDKSEKASANVTGDAFGNFEGPMLSTCSPESCSKSADPYQPGCDSPKVFGTTEIPETKHEKGNIKESTNQNAADTNVVGDGGKHSSNSSNPTGNDVPKDQGYGTSDITSFADLPIGVAANSSQPFPAISAPKIVDGSQTNSASGQMDAKISQEISRGGDGEIAGGGSKGTTERKRRRASSKGTGKESAKKGTVKATTPMRQADRGDKSSSVPLGKSGIFQFAHPSDIQYFGLVDGSSKTYSVLTSATSGLPDLNSSAPASLVFQQPFTDLQQVQLRAQIFVYGALIQGTAPDEAYMVSAYGGPDGGRSIWENAWRKCIERLHSQKSTPINPETLLQSSSDLRFTGGRVPDQAGKQSAFQGKVISSPAGRASTKGIPPTASPMIPISSPLWSIPTPACEAPQYSVLPRGSVMDYQQAHTPLHPFQTSPIRNIVGQNSSWMSQSPFRGPWVPSPQSSAAETSIRFSAFPSTESVLLTPVKETTSSQVSSIKHASSVVTGQTGATTSVFAGVSPLLDSKKVGVASPGEPSSQPKSRKRKKISDSKELGPISLQPQSEPESAITLAVTSSVSTSVVVTAPSTFVSKAMPEKLAMSVSSDHLKKADLGLEQRATLSKETLSKAKEARQQAEEASAHAAAAVGHSQEIWSQLDKQKHSGLTSDAEAKLASAAVAVAAAAAVAKAAAAAANVAANAALQAVLMAEEAYGNQSESMVDLSTDGVNALGLAAPGSVFSAEDGTNSSSSILFAAREAARRRVEAASAASKRAENMDAIVKAAELAAEAVSQAGTVVAMGDPVPLSDLVKAGPEGYWKAPQVSSETVKKSNDGMREQSNFSTVGEDSDKEETLITATKKSPTVGERVTEIIKSALPTAGNDLGKTAEASKDSCIVEGSQVEVFKEGGGFAVGWFTATVLSLQDGKACVCYTELQSDEGSGKLQEWVALDSKDDKPPKIRVARLLTPSLEGTRKRRREAMADYAWSVGDKVDAWIQNSWWEGVVTEKNKKDETILKVHFPAQGETSHVKAWHLRPSLIWKDGEWVEWSSVRNDGSSMEDGLPQEKRIKLGSSTVEGKGKDKTLKSNVLDAGKPEEPSLLNLSANEKVFNIGKNTRIENKLDGARTNRTGLQKEGSVKFGIPKPKRKFMEVSKHYVANQTSKVNESNDSVKFAKYLMPQSSGFRALKNTSKFDTKDKEGADNKLRGFRSEKQRSMSDKTVPQKDNFSIDLVSAADGSSKMDHTRKVKDSVRQAEGLSGKRNIFETGSGYSSDGRAQGAAMFSSRTPSSDLPPSKKVATTTAKSERGNKGNFAPVVGKLGKIEEGKGTSSNPVRSTAEVVEPRRSNRRIQPTSRLLEGLQSSLSISKIPSVSHEKPRSQNRNGSRGSNHD